MGVTIVWCDLIGETLQSHLHGIQAKINECSKTDIWTNDKLT